MSAIARPSLRSGRQLRRLASLALFGLACAGAAETGADPGTLLREALEGQAKAIQTYRETAPQLDEGQARQVLERVRSSGNPRLSGLAAAFLAHPEPFVRQMAVTAIGRLGLDGADTLDRVVKALDDASALVRQSASDTLVQVRDARSWPRLIALLSSDDADRVRLVHDCLSRQCRQSLPAERAAWEAWYQARRTQEESDFNRFRQDLLSTDQGRITTAIDGLAALELMRDQATSLLLPLVQHEQPQVRLRAEQHLRQWTATVGRESLATCLDRAQGVAVAPPPAPPVEAAPAAIAEATRPAEPTKGFLDTNLGMLSVVTALSFILGVLVWFLRTPAGQVVKTATGRFVNKARKTKVVVMIEHGTERIVRPVAKPIKVISERIANQANRAARTAEVATRRFAKKLNRKPITLPDADQAQDHGSLPPPTIPPPGGTS